MDRGNDAIAAQRVAARVSHSPWCEWCTPCLHFFGQRRRQALRFPSNRQAPKLPVGQHQQRRVVYRNRRLECLLVLAARQPGGQFPNHLAVTPDQVPAKALIIELSSIRIARAYRQMLFVQPKQRRSEEHTSELQSLMRISY